MDSDLISIIMPVYNTEKFLKNTLQSVINQTYKNLEIIVVNDGSTDGSEEVVLEAMKTEPRIKYFKTENKWVSAARNLAISKASGKYLSFIDSDDLLDKRFYEILHNVITKYDADIAFAKFQKVPEKTTEIHESYRNENNVTIYNGDEFVKNAFNGNDIYHVIVTNKLFKKELFNDLKFNETVRNAEDVLMMYELSKIVKTIAYVPLRLYGYVQRSTSTIHTFNFSRLLVLPFLEDIIKECHEKNNGYELYIRTWFYFTNLEFLFRVWQCKCYDKEVCNTLIKNIEENYFTVKENKKVSSFRKIAIPLGHKLLLSLVNKNLKKLEKNTTENK